MTTTRMTFTCAPDPRKSAAPRLTVLVSPRLEGAGSQLGQWQLGVWPDLIKAATISLQVNGASVAATPQFDLDRDAWNLIFGPATPVTPYVFEDDKRPIRSYPVKMIEGGLHSIYGNVGANYPRDPAPMFYPSGEGTPVGQMVGLLMPIERWLRGGPDWSPISFTPAEDDPATFFNKYQKGWYDANRFYVRRPQTAPPPDNQRPPPPAHDFHARVAMLADHPTLLRKLGLAFDLTLPAAALTATGTIKLVIDWRGGGSNNALDRCPITHYQYGGGRFLAQAQGGAIDRGYLRPVDATGAKAIEATILDTDGGAVQSVAFALAAQGAAADPTRPPVEATTLPTLRTAGITLVHNARKDWLDARRATTAALEAQGGAAQLWAEDLLRGYRVDVDDGSGTWRSLCRRQGSIAITGRDAPLPVAPEEGYVKAASAASTSGSNELYLHEALAGWDGWSLVTRRPGRTVVFDPTLHKDVVVPAEDGDSAGLGVAASYKPAGSLPRLRYGKSYRLRVRTVDVAGGSVEAEDGESTYVVGPVAFARYEPIAPPVLVPRAPYKEAASIERMVVRTPGYQPGPIIGMPMLVPDDRHVLPPRATLAMCEQHGKLDGAFAAGADLDAWYQVARKEMGTLFDPMVVDLAALAATAVSPAPQLVAPASSLSTTPPSLPAGRGDPIGAGQYVVHSGDEVRLPYLPDPMAAGVMLHDPAPAPDSIGPEFMSTGYGFDPVPWAAPSLSDWPDKKSVRLVVQPILNGPITRQADGSDLRTIVFQLPPGRRLSLRYSSLPYADLSTMALYNLIAPQAPSNVIADMHSGLHGMITPPRTIEMVHATQRPVQAPAWAMYWTQRSAGDTFVTFYGNPDYPLQSGIDVHSWSTSHVDLRATWDEWIDDGVDPAGLRVIRHSADAFRLPVTEGVDRTPFSSTTQPVERRLQAPVGLAPARLTAEAPQPDAVEHPARHEFGDTRHRVVDYTPVATTRFAEYFPADVIADHGNLEVAGETKTVDVLCSSTPAAPKILYAVPTFAWQDGGGLARTRVGRGLRIYLDRPWFQTGAEERLAVILAPPDGPFDDARVSKWGTDPAWTSAATPLIADAFPDTGETINYLGQYPYPRMAKDTLYLLDAGHNVRVVGYLPEWNAERQLWYVDVELASGSAYWPFVSLALARWQPHALDPLSKIVRLHYTQLAVDRAATVSPTGTSIAVRVSGVTAGNSLEYVDDSPGPWLQFKPRRKLHTDSLAAAHRVTARVEQLDPSLDAGDPANQLRWTTVVGPVELGASDGAVGGEVQWNATLSLPATTGSLRVVVTETEMYNSDTGATVLLEGYGTGKGRERVVYMDSFVVVSGGAPTG